VVRIENRILSPTAINTYLACPRKFYLRYIKRLKTKPSIHLLRGLIVHKTLHEFHNKHPGKSHNNSLAKIRCELLSIFNERWNKAENTLNSLNLTNEQIEFYHDDSEVMLLNFSHWFYKNDMPAPELTEARIMSQNLRLMGIIDAVQEENDKVILIDYKTSKHAKITDDIFRQAAIYALLYHDKFKKIPEAIWIHFLKDPGDPMVINVDDELLQYGQILVESIREKTKAFDEQSYPCKCWGFCERDFVGT